MSVHIGRQQMIDLVECYFRGVDGEKFDLIKSTLHPDCVFTVETHDVRLEGHDQIKGMFERLWSKHSAVLHRDFVYAVSPDDNRIAVRFQVVNTMRDGNRIFKSNCNFFDVLDGKFTSVRVYMAGKNTLQPD